MNLIDDMEKAMILKSLEITKGNRVHAAKLIGMPLRTFMRKISQYKKQHKKCKTRNQ